MRAIDHNLIQTTLNALVRGLQLCEFLHSLFLKLNQERKLTTSTMIDSATRKSTDDTSTGDASVHAQIHHRTLASERERDKRSSRF